MVFSNHVGTDNIFLSSAGVEEEICGDGIDNNLDAQIDENCSGKYKEHLMDGIDIGSTTHGDRDTISQNPSNGMTTEGPKAENNKMIPMENEKYGARPQNILDASSYQQIYNNNSNNFNGSSVLNSNIDNAVSTRSWQQEVNENGTVTLSCHICISSKFNAKSYLWEQMSGANKVTLSTPSSRTATFVAPEINSPIDIITFTLHIVDQKGLTHSENIEVTIRNR
jgi:K319L-like, PKD domain